MKKAKVSCVYMIRSIAEPDKFYIGSTADYSTRKKGHRQTLVKWNKHNGRSLKLLEHVKEYGLDDLQFKIIEKCASDILFIREQYWLDTLNPYFNTYLTASDPHYRGCDLNDMCGEKGFKHISEAKVLLYCSQDLIPEIIVPLEYLSNIY
jgi:group I intron endonuclease